MLLLYGKIPVITTEVNGYISPGHLILQRFSFQAIRVI